MDTYTQVNVYIKINLQNFVEGPVHEMGGNKPIENIIVCPEKQIVSSLLCTIQNPFII